MADKLTAREEMARRLAHHAAGGRDLWEYLTPEGQRGWLAMADDAMAGTVRRIRAEAAEYAARGRSDVRAVLEQIAEELDGTERKPSPGADTDDSCGSDAPRHVAGTFYDRRDELFDKYGDDVDTFEKLEELGIDPRSLKSLLSKID